MHPGIAIATLWAVWVLSWLAAAFWTEKTEKRAGFGAEAPYRLMIAIGAILFFIPAHNYHGPLRLWSVDAATAWICTGFVAAGFVFCWWARLHLGKLWSGQITKKAGHRIIDTGPYAIVRHPIYTGLLLSTYATLIAKGTVYGIAGAIGITLGVWLKARLEERFLREELGAETYDTYAQRVPMLVPFGPKSR